MPAAVSTKYSELKQNKTILIYCKYVVHTVFTIYNILNL